ncbi:cob(I)yrinic acid a,c-diamide adenosyltransferase [Herminiimonas fonticola]|uniref:Corrinoid adenosyltransferase n=1 Tax=Herminiimonas fonticola TaxID=303380 RepID=A0A4R6G7B2_9BURK|nr:cob(I)yrinic acid a,c-diamide adenosyltransferase [Herminiimonas fonticola]RBA23870.1 cobA: cob(I)yrinic acid a,c-diamide adenosyltransferase [Herminiimonas fonticola]TDN89870.1 cob(I)alamin adenosyltransferase [Herminiimonas fonticola]
MSEDQNSTDKEVDGVTERHNARMARKKEVVDKKIEAAKRDAGVLLITCGNGKGKSSSAFGMAARALGHGMKVGVVQFIKGAIATGEENFFRRFPDEISFHVMGEGYTWETQNRERDVKNAEIAWDKAKELLSDPKVGLIVLDELNIALKYKYLDVQRVIEDLQARPAMQHVVITGRGAPPELIAVADTVTEMQPIKHAFAAGIAAQAGVEW